MAGGLLSAFGCVGLVATLGGCEPANEAVNEPASEPTSELGRKESGLQGRLESTPPPASAAVRLPPERPEAGATWYAALALSEALGGTLPGEAAGGLVWGGAMACTTLADSARNSPIGARWRRRPARRSPSSRGRSCASPARCCPCRSAWPSAAATQPRAARRRAVWRRAVQRRAARIWAVRPRHASA